MDTRKILLITLLCLSSGLAFAQDEIILVSGDKVMGKVLEITLESILYQPQDSLESITMTLPKKEVFMIRYANGTKSVFQENLPSTTSPIEASPASPQQMYALGQQDARLYYKGNGALWGSAACALTFYGLVGSVVIAAVKPEVRPDRVSDVNLIADPNYYMGYQKTAHRRKIGKAAIGAGIGSAVLPVVILVVLMNTYN